MDSQLIQKWMKSCRLCLMDDGVKLPIFGEEGIVREVAHKIQACFPIVLYNADPLSKIICQRCLFMLDTVYNFRQKCVETNAVFTSHLRGLKSNSSSVKQYLQTLEKSGLLGGISCSGQQAADPLLHVSETRCSIPYQGSGSPSQHSKDNVSAESLPILKIADPLAQPAKKYPVPPIHIKQEKGLTSPSKTVPLIISVVGSYSGSNSTYQDERPTDAEPNRNGPVKREYAVSGRKAREGQRTKSPWLCEYCNKYYKSRQTLWKHQKYFCTGECYHCGRCNKMFNTNQERIVHWGTHLRVLAYLREESLSSCNVCNKRFSSKALLNNHMKVHQNEDQLVGGLGSLHDLPGRTLSNVEKSAQGVYGNVPLRSVPITKSKVFIRHRHQCDYCPNAYARRDKLIRHKRIHHRQETCPPVSFISRALPTPASDTNPPEQRYRPAPLSKQKHILPIQGQGLLRTILLQNLKCEVCFKVFTKKSSLTNHMRTHSNNAGKVNRCPICSRLFGSSKGLNYHMTIKHRGAGSTTSAHYCKSCNLGFKSRSEYLLHSLSHGKIKKETDVSDEAGQPLLCSYCNQVFYKSAELKVHLLSHKVATNVPTKLHAQPAEPLACNICGKLFNSKRNVARHKKIHLARGNNCISCDICGKKFLSKSFAQQHAATHLLSKTFHCSGCNKIFFKEEGLQNHSCASNSTIPSNDGEQAMECAKEVGNEFPAEEPSGFCKSCGYIGAEEHVCQNQWTAPIPKSAKAKNRNSYKTYKCKVCYQVFNSCYSHNSHMKVHSYANRRRHILKVPRMAAEPSVIPEISNEVNSIVECTMDTQPVESVNTAPLDLRCSATDADEIIMDTSITPPQTQGEGVKLPDTDKNSCVFFEENEFFECNICSQKFHSQYGLDSHILSHNEAGEPKPLQCPLCPLQHISAVLLNEHIALDHPENIGMYQF